MANKVQKKRKRIRLKKSVRRTIAALLLVTSIIVAAVPVRSVSALGEEDWNNTAWMDIEKIVADGAAGSPQLANHVQREETKKVFPKVDYDAFPVLYDNAGEVVKETIIPIQGGDPLGLIRIDTSGYTGYQSGVTKLFPIYEIGQTDNGVTIKKFKNTDGYGPVPDPTSGKYRITLGNEVCYGTDFPVTFANFERAGDKFYATRYSNGPSGAPDITPVTSYEITFNSQGGSEVPYQTVEAGGRVTKPEDPTNPDSTLVFAGWYTDPDCTNEYKFSTEVNSGFTLYAKWIAGYQITFELNGGTLNGESTCKITVESGGSYEKPAGDPIKASTATTNYTFAGWYEEADFRTLMAASYTAGADRTFYAKWEETPVAAGEHTVTFTISEDEFKTPGTTSSTVTDGKTVDQPDDPEIKDDYTATKEFDGWYNGADKFDFATPITGDLTLTAHVKDKETTPETVTVTFHANTGYFEKGGEHVVDVTFTIEKGGKLSEDDFAILNSINHTNENAAFHNFSANSDNTATSFQFILDAALKNTTWPLESGGTTYSEFWAHWTNKNTNETIASSEESERTEDIRVAETRIETPLRASEKDITTKTYRIDSLSELGAPDSSSKYMSIYKYKCEYIGPETDEGEVQTDTNIDHWKVIADPENGRMEGEYCSELQTIFQIEPDAFSEGTSNAEEIILPKYIESIGDRAFKGCGLNTIAIGNECKTIGVEAFGSCSALKEVSFAEAGALESLGDGAFAGCSSLAKVTMPPTRRLPLKEIGCGCFLGCSSLTTIPFNNDVMDPNIELTIGSYAFADCNLFREVDWSRLNIGGLESAHGLFASSDDMEGSSLLSVHFPTSFDDSIKADNFENCFKLVYLRFHNNGTVYTDGTPKYEFVSSSNLERYIQYLIDNWSTTPKPTEKELDYVTYNVDESFYIWGPNYKQSPKAFQYAKLNGNTYRFDDSSDPTTNQNYTVNAGGYSLIADVNTKAITSVVDVDRSLGLETLSIPGTVIADDNYEKVVIDTIGDNFSQSLTNIGDSHDDCLDEVKKIVIQPDIHNVGEHAFSGYQKDDGSWSGIPNLTELEAQVDDEGLNLGNNAFENCSLLKTAEFIPVSADDKDNSGLAIGSKCFWNCSDLELVSFRDYDIESEDSNPDFNVNVTAIGADAFLTNRTTPVTDPELTGRYGKGRDNAGYSLYVLGRVDEPDYIPFQYCLNGQNRATNKDNMEGYITYVSGNPENIALKYFEELKGASLLTYPTEGTVVEATTASTGEGTTTAFTTIGDLLKRTTKLSVGEAEVLNHYKSMDIPTTVTTLEKAYNMTQDVLESDFYPYITYVDTEDGDGNIIGGMENLTIENVSKLPAAGYSQATYDATVNTTLQNPDRLNTTLSNNARLASVTFNANVTDLGSLPFYNDTALHTVNFAAEGEKPASASSAAAETISGEGTLNAFGASSSDPYYWEANEIIYSTDGTTTTLEEVLPSRGVKGTTEDTVNLINSIQDPDLLEVTDIATGAFQNCDQIYEVDLADTGIKIIPDYCFYDCDNLQKVKLPATTTKVGTRAFAQDEAITIEDYSIKTQYQADSFDYDNTTIYGYSGSAAEQYVEDYDPKHQETIRFIPFDNAITVYFMDEGNIVAMYQSTPTANPIVPGTVLYSGDFPTVFPYSKEGYTFLHWHEGTTNTDFDSYFQIPKDFDSTTLYFIAQWKQDIITKVQVTFFDRFGMEQIVEYDKGTEITDALIPVEVRNTIHQQTGKRANFTFKEWNPKIPYTVTADCSIEAIYDKNSSTGGGGSGSSSGSSSNSSSSKSSSSSRSSSSSSGSSSATNSSTAPVAVSGEIAGYTPVSGGVVASTHTGSSGTGTTGGGRAAGNTTVQSTTPGISDPSKMSATVNGSSDNYTLKISETEEANRLAEQALINKYGSLENIRYLPIDITLYDSTGQNKISPIPEGTSVSVTVPIPDDLAIYGGNAKAAGTEGGVLDELNPRFTVINGVPCMGMTLQHLSPYVIYVDTANLSDPAMMDTTPKTGDPIHPKWFLAIGLFAASIFMFLKRDKEERRAIA